MFRYRHDSTLTGWKYQSLLSVGKAGLLLLFLTTSSRAFADSIDGQTSTGSTPPVAEGANIPGGGAPTTAITPQLESSSNVNALQTDPYYDYRRKGLIVNLPGPSGTVDQGLGGLRQKIADKYGIGYIGFTVDTFYDNLLHAAHSVNGSQTYAGQRPTGTSVSTMAVTIDLGRYGVPDGQIVLSGLYQSVSWNPAGPNDFGFNTISYYQTLFNKRVEVKFGLIGQSYEFAGTFVGGSLSGGVFGTSGNLFTESGQNGQSDPTYAINITTHVTKFFYDKLGVGRAVNPDGTIREHSLNQIGLNFATKNSGLWLIDEFGYLRPAAPGQDKIWVRGGAVLSEARYAEVNNPTLRGNNNYEFYLLGDRQLLQPSSAPKQAYRGLYAGFSAEFVPPSYNKFTQYYELRLYALGPLPGRPHDQVSLVANDSEFSKLSVRAASRAGHTVHSDTQTITLSYSAQVFPGAFLNLGVGYTDRPSPIVYTSNTGSDLNFIVGISLYL